MIPETPPEARPAFPWPAPVLPGAVVYPALPLWGIRSRPHCSRLISYAQREGCECKERGAP